MARLSRSQALNLITNPKNKQDIEYACFQEQWLRMHCDPIQQKGKLPARAYREFSQWLQSFTTADKTKRILSLLNTPFETVATTKSIFDQFTKIFEAQDRFLKNEFVDTDLQSDFDQYLDKLKDSEFWQTQGMEALRIGINSFLVCDTPEEQITAVPEPYYYKLDITNVIDVDINKRSGAVEYIVIRQDDLTVLIIDDEFYRVYRAKDKDGGMLTLPYVGRLSGTYAATGTDLDDNEYKLIREVPHSEFSSNGTVLTGTGYCPVIDFYGDVISNTNRIDKRGPISDVITKLNFLLLFLTLAKYYYMYGPFPIICSYRIKNKYLDDKNREVVDTGGGDGISINQYSAYDIVAVDIIDPKKQPRNFIAPGSAIATSKPEFKDEHDAMQFGPIKVIEMNVENLDWVKGYTEYLANDIKRICTGATPKVNNAAKNEDQVGEGLEEQKTILTNIAKQFARAQKFMWKTLAIRRYGRQYHVSTTVDYGTDFFLKDACEITEEMLGAKKAGMNQGYLITMRNNVITTRFRNNQDELARQRILLALEPYPDMTWQEVKNAGLDQADWIKYVVKTNFYTFIERFQTDYADIVVFMAKSDYKLKIAFIEEKLAEYGQQIKQPAREPELNGGGPN